MRNLVHFAVFAAVLLGLSSCDSKGVTRPPASLVRFIHAAASAGSISFLREEKTEAELEFGDGRSVTFDSGPYDFNLEVFVPSADDTVRVASAAHELDPEREQVFVVTDEGGGLDWQYYEFPVVDTEAAEGRLLVINAAHGKGAMDMHLMATGGTVSPATLVGSAAFTEYVEISDSSGEEKQLSLTTPGTTDLQYQSVPLVIIPGSSNLIVIADAGGLGLSDLILFSLQSSASLVADANADAGFRVINAAADEIARDVYVDEEAVNALFSTLPFATVPDFETVDPGERTFHLTPISNPGSSEAEVVTPAVTGRLHTVLFAGNSTDGIQGQAETEDLRSISGQASLRVLNGASAFNSINVYIQPPGTNIATVFPTLSFSAPTIGSRVIFEPGDYELTFEDGSTRAPLADPFTVTLEDGGIYGLLAVNAPGGSTVDFVYYDDFN